MQVLRTESAWIKNSIFDSKFISGMFRLVLCISCIMFDVGPGWDFLFRSEFLLILLNISN